MRKLSESDFYTNGRIYQRSRANQKEARIFLIEDITTNGDICEGMWFKGKPDYNKGRGMIRYANGDQYFGNFATNDFVIQGESLNDSQYEDNKRKGIMKHGEGVFISNSGIVTKGKWKFDWPLDEREEEEKTEFEFDSDAERYIGNGEFLPSDIEYEDYI